jgi:hypothetical protein
VTDNRHYPKVENPEYEMILSDDEISDSDEIKVDWDQIVEEMKQKYYNSLELSSGTVDPGGSSFLKVIDKIDDLVRIVDKADDTVKIIKETVNLTRQSVNDKLARYLLNMEHPVGGSKAKWFKKALGFTKDNMDDLAKQIVFDSNKAVQTGITEYGTKFNQTISINGANGKVIDVTFAWMKSVKDDIVRLVTAIPTKK